MAGLRQVWIFSSFAATALWFGQIPAPSLASANSVDEDETVVVRSSDGHTVRIGAGVIVGRDGGRLLIATASHVLGNSSSTVQLDSGTELSVTKIERIEGFDLAVLVTAPYSGVADIAIPGRPTLGENVHIWGHRLARDYVESGASIIDLDPTLPEGAANGRFAIDCADCDHGDSGGGVFDDHGRLLGILEGVRRDQFGDIAFVQVEPIEPLEADLAAAL